MGNLDSLTRLYLNSNQLTGQIPIEITNLTNLRYLYLNGNQLSGSIPNEIGNLSNLNYLSLGSNQLSGSIPSEIGNMTYLLNLGLSHNQLTGVIPPEIGNLENLRTLVLKDNLLTGTIPEQIWDLDSLRQLHVGINDLTGNIPTKIGNLTNLLLLQLYSNQFSGIIPSTIGNLTNLALLNISDNNFSGSIPFAISSLANLSFINISDNQFTSLPDLSPLTNLDSLYIQNNRFTFYDIEPNIGIPSENFVYTPQSPIPIVKDTTLYLASEMIISVSAGGDNCQYQWFKDYNPQGGLTDDSTRFISPVTLSDAGDYYCWATNTAVPGLTLYSDTAIIEVIDAILVSNTQDSGIGSLRNAIEFANAKAGRDSIVFNIPGWGIRSIEPDSPLPDITDPVVIDGYTQPGAYKATASDTAILKIALDGINHMSLVVPGLKIEAGNSTIRGLMINRYGAFGIHIQGAGNNIIEGNFIGVDSSGWVQISNQEGALRIVDSRDNVIGGDLPEHQNIMVGGMYVIQIESVNSENNLIKGNMLGVGRHGLISPTTQGINIRLVGEAHHNTIGPGNVIAGHDYAGIHLGPTTRNTTIIGNYLGINGSGNDNIQGGPNSIGVAIEGAVDNTIGPGNVISGQEKGVYIALSEFGRPQDDASGNIIIGNLIGTNSDGTTAIPNEIGIEMDNVPGVIIGGLSSVERNIVSGNDIGINIFGLDADQNTVLGNYVGTNFDGADTIPNNNGVKITEGSDNIIGGSEAGARNIISGNNGDGVWIQGSPSSLASGNKIQGNYIGLTADGSDTLGNRGFGVKIREAAGNLVGGPNQGEGNVISANGTIDPARNGIHIEYDTSGIGNVVQGNFVGTDPTGMQGWGNFNTGIMIFNASHNSIIDNVVADNGLGIAIFKGTDPQQMKADFNKVKGNLIGTKVNGTEPLGNKWHGILMRRCNNNIIGGTTPEDRNIISGNEGWGIFLGPGDAANNIIAGNFVGTDVNGTGAIGNDGGIWIGEGASNNKVGGTTKSERNIISGNGDHSQSHGLVIADAPTTGNKVLGNYIGLDVTGKEPLGNAGDGVQILNSAYQNYIGGINAGERNVIAGNGVNGIALYDTAFENEIKGNFIGLDASGTKNIGHPGGTGIYIGRYSHHNLVGGTEPGAANHISGNTGWAGIAIHDVGTDNNMIYGNYLGTDITGNEEFGNLVGVRIADGASNNQVGGMGNGQGNLIAYSLEEGVLIYDEVPIDPSETSGNLILSNLIHSNESLGIDLGNDGVTENDEDDADGSPNNLQNYPVLDSIGFSPGEVTIGGSLNSTPGTEFILQFFASLLSDHSTYGEGETYLGSEIVITNAQGNALFSVTFHISNTSGQVITATATDPAGNTSEFSQAIGGVKDQILSPLNRPFYYSINQNGVPLISDESDINAVKNAFQTWTDVPTADIEFISEGTTSAQYASATDGVNLVTFQDDRFPFGPNILAVAAKTLKMGPGDQVAEIMDADIIFNPEFVNHQTYNLGVGNAGYFDIQSVTTHEIGHVLGLFHSGIPISTMFPILDSGTVVRSLEKDDIAWVSHKYPGSEYFTSFGFISGRITYGEMGDINNPETHPPVAGALVLAVHTETNEQIHSYSDADGNYLVPIPLDGTGPESYWIYIQPLDGDVFDWNIRPGNISSYIYANTIYTDYINEFYNAGDGPLEDPNQHTEIQVSAGVTVGDIDLITNIDIIQPEVTSVTPKNDSTGFRVIDPVIIVFSEDIDLNSISDDNCYLTYELDGNAAYVYGNSIPLDESSSDRIVFQPDEALQYTTEYTIHIETSGEDISGITDLKGNVLLETFTSAFTTEDGDDDSPEITDIIPANNAVNVFVTDQILVFFSEPMDRANTTGGFSLSTDGTANLEGSFEWNPENTLMTFTPLGSMLEGTEYFVTLSTGITDLAGNAMLIESVDSFTTVPEANPEITYLGPGDGDIDITVETPVMVDFTEPINTSTVNTNTLRLLRGDGGQVPGNIEFLLDDSRIVFRPDTNLNFNETYTIVITGGNTGIHDVSNPSLPLENTSTTTFQTATEPLLPQIGSINPPRGVWGAVVTINGSGFDPIPDNNTVLFNGIQASVTRSTLNSLIMKVPLGTVSGPVTVSVNGSIPSDPWYFDVIPQSLEPCDEVIGNVNSGSRSRGVAISPNSAYAYVVNSGGDNVSVIDLNAQTPIVTTTILVGETPLMIDINPDGTLAYVTNFTSHTVSVIDLSTNTVIKTIPVGVNPYGIAVTHDGKRVYVANYTSENISMIDVDPASGGFNQVVANVNSGTRNRSVAITPNAALVLVTGDNGLTVINSDPEDVNFNSVIANVSSGTRTRGVAISPNAGIAIVSTMDGNLLIIDIIPTSNSFSSVIANMNTGSRARGVAISPDAMFVYVTRWWCL
jgi:YVTN family beta-propeller protein